MHYQDGNIHYEYQETEKLADLIKGVQPNSIFVPHKGEGWNDHLQVRNMIQKLIKNNSDIRLYEYCVWFWYYNTWNIDWKHAFILSMTKAEHLLKNQAMIHIYYLKLLVEIRGVVYYRKFLLKLPLE